jgi:hypothetical protein
MEKPRVGLLGEDRHRSELIEGFDDCVKRGPDFVGLAAEVVFEVR